MAIPLHITYQSYMGGFGAVITGKDSYSHISGINRNITLLKGYFFMNKHGNCGTTLNDFYLINCKN